MTSVWLSTDPWEAMLWASNASVGRALRMLERGLAVPPLDVHSRRFGQGEGSGFEPFHVPHATSLWSGAGTTEARSFRGPRYPNRWGISRSPLDVPGWTGIPCSRGEFLAPCSDALIASHHSSYPAPLYARESDASTCHVCRSFAGPCRQCPRGRFGRSGGARLGLLVRLHEFARHNWRARVRRDEAREMDAHGDHRGWFVGARLVHRHGRREHELGMLLRAGGRAAARRRGDRRHGLQPRPGRGSARGVLHGDRRTGGAASRPRVDDGSAACSRPGVDDDPAA